MIVSAVEQKDARVRMAGTGKIIGRLLNIVHVSHCTYGEMQELFEFARLAYKGRPFNHLLLRLIAGPRDEEGEGTESFDITLEFEQIAADDLLAVFKLKFQGRNRNPMTVDYSWGSET